MPSQDSSSRGRIENGCACATWFRKDGKLSVMEDERIDPLSADNAMQRVQWHSHFFQNILKQDSTTAAALLHKAALSITVWCALADMPINMVKVLLILSSARATKHVASNVVRPAGAFLAFRAVSVWRITPHTAIPCQREDMDT
jgi:hypothetical protein